MLRGKIDLRDFDYPGGLSDAHSQLEKLAEMCRRDEEAEFQAVNTMAAMPKAACNPPKLHLTDAEIEEMFTYHPPNSPEQVQAYANINHAAKTLARAIRDNCPSSEDARQAISMLRMARMMANSAIANEGRF